MVRPLTSGVERPPCPRGHDGIIYLDGRRKTTQGGFERTRFRCVPREAGEKTPQDLAQIAATPQVAFA
jgi:hypothetical protein